MHTFVVPPFDGPPSGGTRFNAELVGALQKAGERITVIDLDRARRSPPRTGRLWVDTLFLEKIAEVAAAIRDPARVGLLVHYLPSLVAKPTGLDRSMLTAPEQAGLRVASWFVVPSPFMKLVLAGLGVSPQRIRVVEPGYEAPQALAGATLPRATARCGCEAVMVANLVEGKGVAPFLEALARTSDALSKNVGGDGAHKLRLTILGGRPDAAYAHSCEEAARAATSAGCDVRLVGPLDAGTCLRWISTADLFVSASRMESFGMAVAEARACGVPILALPGGNVKSLVTAGAGGELAGDPISLARRCIELAQDPAELARRRSQAQAYRIARPWSRVAADFLARNASKPPA